MCFLLGAYSSSTPVPSTSPSRHHKGLLWSWDVSHSDQRQTGAVRCALHRDQPLRVLHQARTKQRRLDLLRQHGRQTRWVVCFCASSHSVQHHVNIHGLKVCSVQERVTASTFPRFKPALRLADTWICLPGSWPVRCLETWKVWPSVSSVMHTCTCIRATTCVCIAEGTCPVTGKHHVLLIAQCIIWTKFSCFGEPQYLSGTSARSRHRLLLCHAVAGGELAAGTWQLHASHIPEL